MWMKYSVHEFGWNRSSSMSDPITSFQTKFLFILIKNECIWNHITWFIRIVSLKNCKTSWTKAWLVCVWHCVWVARKKIIIIIRRRNDEQTGKRKKQDQSSLPAPVCGFLGESNTTANDDNQEIILPIATITSLTSSMEPQRRKKTAMKDDLDGILLLMLLWFKYIKYTHVFFFSCANYI